jgi:transposase InsO family protein
MFIKEHRKQYGIKLLCKVLAVSASGYHKWLKRKGSQRVQENQRLLEIIRLHYNKSRSTYGLPRIYAAIRKQGLSVNKKRIGRLMRINKIKAKTKRNFKITTKQNSSAKASENILNKNFTSERENRIWTSEYTCGHQKAGFIWQW